MKNNGINVLGLISLIILIVGGMTSAIGVGIILGLIGLVLTTILYAKIDKLGYGTNLFNMSIYQCILALVPTALLMYYGVNAYANKTHGAIFLIIVLVFALLLFLAIINYFVGKGLLIISEKTGNQWFKVSGTLTKVGAYTMLLLGFGLLFVVLAQPFFLVGCITYKPLTNS